MDDMEALRPKDAAYPPEAVTVLAAGFFAEWTVSGRDCKSSKLSPSGRSASMAHSIS